MKTWSHYFLVSLFCLLCLTSHQAFAQKNDVDQERVDVGKTLVLVDCCLNNKKDEKCCTSVAAKMLSVGISGECAESDINCLGRLFRKNLKLTYPNASKQMINKTIKNNPNLQKEFMNLQKELSSSMRKK